MADDSGTPTKRFSSLKDVCRTCNNNIILKNHPLDLFGDKAKEERIVADLEKMFGLKITRDDGLPSRTCRSCYGKVSKIRAFAKMIFESKAQQESVVRAKRGKSVGYSPTSATSPGSKREKRRGAVEERSKVKAALFAPEVSPNITPMSLILPAEPKEQEAGVESMGTTATKRRKLPTGIAPPEIEFEFEILSNSGLRNPGLTKDKPCLDRNTVKMLATMIATGSTSHQIGEMIMQDSDLRDAVKANQASLAAFTVTLFQNGGTQSHSCYWRFWPCWASFTRNCSHRGKET